MNRLAILLFLFIVISGCKLTYRVLLGVDTTPKWIDNEKIIKQSEKHEIPFEYSLVLDTASYNNLIDTILKEELYRLYENGNFDSSYARNLRIAAHDDIQPTQFRLFNSEGTELFKLNNCYIEPLIPMRWNIDSCFDSFPPEISFESLNIHNYDLSFLLANSYTLNNERISFEKLLEYDYYGVIMWNYFYKRPSRRLIREVRKYFDGIDVNVLLIYINNHNAQIWYYMDPEAKEKVKKYYNGRS